MFAGMDARAIKASGRIRTFLALLYANTSTATTITEKILLKVLWGEEPIGDWLPHVYSFFNECPWSVLFDFSEENQIPLVQMKRIFYQIPVESWSPFLALCVKHGISEAMSREKADNILKNHLYT